MRCKASATLSLKGVKTCFFLLSGCAIRLSQLPLDVVEELLDWIQPRGVLGVEENVRPKLACGCIHGLVLVDTRVIHQDNDLLRFSLPVDS